MFRQLKNLEAILMLFINVGAALVVAGAVLTLINIIEASLTLAGFDHGYNMPKGVSLSIAIVLALFATWKVNGRFIIRGD